MVTLAPYDFDEHVDYAGFVDDQPVFALADGLVRLPLRGDEAVQVHDGLLSAQVTLDGKYLVTGGEDGCVVRTNDQGDAEKIAFEHKRWIDTLACGPNGAIAFASGREVWMVTQDTTRHFDHARAVEGLAFAPKGVRLACARYNGVTLHWGAPNSTPVDLQWDGAHTGVTFSPDGKYVVSSMAENALHGWRMDDKKSGDGKHMRMTGYPSKPKCLSWSLRGKWLASSGAQAAICWPFSGKDGPMGKAPKELGTRGDSLVVQVACHPAVEVIAIGYADGMIMLVKIDDGTETLLRRPGKGAISSINWDAKGDRLAFGSEEGEGGLVTIS